MQKGKGSPLRFKNRNDPRPKPFVEKKKPKIVSPLSAILKYQFAQFDLDSKVEKKRKRLKHWDMPNISIPGLQVVKHHNKKITERRIIDLKKRIDAKERRAEEHVRNGQPGRAIKMMKRRRGNVRELNRIS